MIFWIISRQNIVLVKTGSAISKLYKGNLEPMFLGLAVFVYGITFSYNTGYAINPARDLGPRLFIYIIGKLFRLAVNFVAYL